jgi:4'-phosphopantetheinyl transferase
MDMDMDMDSEIPLTFGEIHLWLAFYDGIDGSLYAAYRELLNPVEKEQELQFHFANDQHRYLITRALVRTVLSRYVSIHPKEWIFSTNSYGRPEIVNAQARDLYLSFNISHADSLIVLGITKCRAIGVDVENFQTREALIDIAEHYFAPQEVAALSAMPSDEQQYRFFEYWTFKESYTKARGMGLLLPLDKFSFHFRDDSTVEIAIHPELVDDAARWQFWQLRSGSQYVIAVCAERLGGEIPRLVVREVIPMLSEKEIVSELLRISV